jgi:general secretion pathway protein A
MYLDFFGLREMPFELTANPRYLFLTGQHREALGNLQYGLSAAKAVTALIGEAGTGKTTIVKAALASERCRDVRAITISNPTLTRGEFVEFLARSLGLTAGASQSKARFIEEIESVLREQRARGVTTALVVDEAQSLSTELLEEVRLLANIENLNEKLLPLVLVGQPDLGRRLEEASLRQLKQRIALRCELGPFTLQETAAYIASRIERAGGSAIRLFTREAVMRVHDGAGGIPRTVSVICDNALLQGFALGRQPVGQDIVLDVCRDFRLSGAEMDRPIERPVAAQVHRPPAAAVIEAPAPEPEVDEEPEPAVAAAPRFGLFGVRRR